MTGSANVRSLDGITAVRSALVMFREQIEQSLSEVAIEMRRVQDWLEHDRPRFWRNQVRLAMDQVTAARAALHRCLMYPVADERPSCREERADLERAEVRLTYCREKQERLKHWTREVRHELFEYEGRIGQLVELVEVDVPQAISILDRLLARLHEYQAIRPTEGSASFATGSALAAELWPERKNASSPDTASVAEGNTPEETVEHLANQSSDEEDPAT